MNQNTITTEILYEFMKQFKEVTVSFTRSWMAASFFISVLSVLIVLAVEKGLT